ncbi:unnamed protein product [Protopolystoma xenopodis]|uniref:Clp1 C-terminal domain-containing protein n=1 Tax=Protopolystoma xenopodis TaxID=117903 RepID=A0A3S5ANH8_9PLAT|nr:unnamed protein product [Protopolystoma xenopodis]
MRVRLREGNEQMRNYWNLEAAAIYYVVRPLGRCATIGCYKEMCCEYTIYKVGSEAIPDALLPHGEREEETWRNPIQVPVSRDLKHRLLAVSQAGEADQVPESPVFGFVVVIAVSDDRTNFTVLSPSPYELPNTNLLLTSLCYVDPEQF